MSSRFDRFQPGLRAGPHERTLCNAPPSALGVDAGRATPSLPSLTSSLLALRWPPGRARLLRGPAGSTSNANERTRPATVQPLRPIAAASVSDLSPRPAQPLGCPQLQPEYGVFLLIFPPYLDHPFEFKRKNKNSRGRPRKTIIFHACLPGIFRKIVHHGAPRPTSYRAYCRSHARARLPYAESPVSWAGCTFHAIRATMAGTVPCLHVQ